MDTIRDWAFNICITLVVTGIFGMLVPKGSFEKIIKFTVSVFFLTCLITPFLNGGITLELPNEDDFYGEGNAAEIEAVVNNQIKETARLNLEKELEKILNEAGMNFDKIEINVNIDDQSRIYINDISITVNGPNDNGTLPEEMEVLVSEKMGVRPEIIIK